MAAADRVPRRERQHQGRDHGQDGSDDGHQLQEASDDGEQHREREEHRVDQGSQEQQAQERRHAHHQAQEQLSADPAAHRVVHDAHDSESVATPAGRERLHERSSQPAEVLEHVERPDRDDEIAEGAHERGREASRQGQQRTEVRARPRLIHGGRPDRPSDVVDGSPQPVRQRQARVPGPEAVQHPWQLVAEALQLVAHRPHHEQDADGQHDHDDEIQRSGWPPSAGSSASPSGCVRGGRPMVPADR